MKSKLFKFLLLLSILLGFSQAALAESRMHQGRLLMYYTVYSMDKARSYTLETMPSGAVGLYNSYALFPWAGRLNKSTFVIGYMRDVTDVNGYFVTNKIEYSCRSNLNHECVPLNSLPVFVKRIGTSSSRYVATIPTMEQWFRANNLLSVCRDVSTYENFYLVNDRLQPEKHTPLY